MLSIPSRLNAAIGVFLILASAAGFALLPVWAKLAYMESVTTLALMTLRVTYTLPLLWLVVWWRSAGNPALGSTQRMVFCLIAGMFGYYLAGYFGLEALARIDAAVEGVIFGSFPVMVLLINSIIRRRWPPLMHLVVLGATQIGIYMVIGGGSRIDIFSQNLPGAALALLSGLCCAISIVMNDKVAQRIEPFNFVTLAMTGGAVGIAAHFIIAGSWDELDISFPAKLVVFASSATIVMASLCFAEGIKRIGGNRSVLISTTTPIFTIIFAHIWLGEMFLPVQWIGSIVVIAALILLESPLGSKNRSAHTGIGV